MVVEAIILMVAMVEVEEATAEEEVAVDLIVNAQVGSEFVKAPGRYLLGNGNGNYVFVTL
jgi:hypothetical protein